MKTNVLLAALLLLLLCRPAAAGGRMVFSTQDIPPFSMEDGTGFIDTLFREIGRRAGLSVTVVQQPDLRSLIQTDSGINDGDGPRVAGLEDRFPNLIRVEEPVLLGKLAAFAPKGMVIAEWGDLAGKNAALPRGWVLPRDKAPADLRLTEVHATHNGMAMLDSGRVDAVLTMPAMGRYEIRRHGFHNINPECVILDRRPLYLYLHAKHAELAPILAEAAKEVKADGTYDRLFREAVARHDPQ